MDARAASKKRRPWWRLHVTTLFALAAVGSALGYCQSRAKPGPGFGFDLLVTYGVSDYGWPLHCLTELSSWNSGGSAAVISGVRWQSDAPAALFDLASAFLVIISTIVACEVWRRRDLRWWQFSMRSFFVLTTIGTLVAALYLNQLSIPWCRSDLHPKGQMIYRCGLADSAFDPTPWYVTAAMLFGIGCVVYSSGFAAWNMGAVSWRLARRSRISRHPKTAP